LLNNTSGANNVAIANSALQTNSTGSNNPAVGDTAGLTLTVTYTAAANGAYVIKAGDRIQFDYFY
jgi:hypothetical protein